MSYLLYCDGEKVKIFPSFKKANDFADKHCRYGKTRIVSLTETKLPKASRMHYNEFFENLSAYKYNPFALSES